MFKFTKEIKESVLKEYELKKPVKEICKIYSISRATLYNWVKLNSNIENTNKITYQDYYLLQKKFETKELELKIYEKLHCFKDSSIKEKEKAIEKYYGIYPIKTMCRLLDIPKGTYYNYHFRKKNITQNNIRNEILKQKILEIYLSSEKRFGVKKICNKLRVEGINTTFNKVKSLMKLLNIKSTQTIHKKEIPLNNNSKYYINKLKRVFTQDAPNKYWVSDVTEIRVSRNRFYLCVVLDLFSRKVVAYRVSSQNNTQLTINTFKDAFESRNRPNGLSFHSDQGANYTSFEFRDLLYSLKVNQSFSKKGNPYDNACMESFFSNYKREEYNTKYFEHFDELERSIASYMKYYNDYRPHQTLKNKTPKQFEEEFYHNKYNKKATT